MTYKSRFPGLDGHDGSYPEPSCECSSVSAGWCPIHGDCACPRNEDGETVSDDDPDLLAKNSERCPLHAPWSTHGEKYMKTRAISLAEPWTYRVIRLKNNRQEIEFLFQGRYFAKREWYPPSRNEQERDNAKCIVDDLNAAFKKRNGEL